jgi:predicted nucleic acid-binding protein
MKFVLDASAIMAWCFEDETTQASERILRDLFVNEAVVPSLWPFEVANALNVAVRGKRITVSDGERFLGLLLSFPIETEQLAWHKLLPSLLSLASQHHISGYDAAYLELALREALPLATLDLNLKKIAAGLGVALVA